VNVTFYDVGPGGRHARITRLVDAAWQRGKRLVITCGTGGEAAELDELLWTFEQGSFIPHEIVAAGQAPADPDARVVIVVGESDPIGADVLLQAAPVTPGFARGFAVVIDLVDHRSEEALAASRARYKAWVSAGVKPAFISG
jgi:DNA polymerase IIIc chi subunit